jgi:hypothetical protein
MDVYSKHGTKVCYANFQCGLDYDQEHARKHLKPDGVYTVNGTSVGTWSSTVRFIEVPGVEFNTVMFTPVEG